ncbi:Nidogen-2 [Pteropus alecto]|uniref:Nidogen-2 n=1 Tax=Pteropus alecto TaxID=9402 RepID=L5L2N7_PTEAL|nr:Nidogen-2 [Pteropus alecto]
MARRSTPVLASGDEQGHFLPLQCHGITTSAGAWTRLVMKSLVPGLHPAPLHLTVDHQSPPRGPRPSVSNGGKTCSSTTVARPGMTRVPQCDDLSHFTPLQCMGRVTSAEKRCRAPALSQAPPLDVYPRLLHHSPAPPRPDVTPPSMGTFRLYAQGQQISHLPLNGARLQKDIAKTLPSPQGSTVVGIDYDCGRGCRTGQTGVEKLPRSKRHL